MRRAAYSLFAFAVLAAGVLDATWPWPSPTSHAQAPAPELIIEILPGGFNPPECTINRNLRAEVRFVNRDTKPRRIVVDELYAPEPGGFSRDTGWLEPGETQSGYWSFGEIQDLTYRDHDDPSLTGHITVPMSNTAATACAPQTGPPPPSGEGCSQHFSEPLGCAIVPRLTADGTPG